MPDVVLSQLEKQVRILEEAPVRLGRMADQDALRALRAALRRLRTLLHPFRRYPRARAVLQAAADLARLTGPLRDDEVLLAELKAHGQLAAVRRRAPAMRRARLALLRSDALQQVQVTAVVALAELQAGGLRRRPSAAALRRARRALQAWPAEQGDLHDLRLRLKRLRYRLQVEPGAPAHLQALLRQLQTLLGAWHDHDVWLQRALDEPDLQPCVARWQHEQQVIEARLPPLLDGLWRLLSA